MVIPWNGALVIPWSLNLISVTVLSFLWGGGALLFVLNFICSTEPHKYFIQSLLEVIPWNSWRISMDMELELIPCYI